MHDFKHRKLHAFGKDCTIEKMDKVRELQERMVQLHFELDNMTEGLKRRKSGEINEELGNPYFYWLKCL